MAKGLILGQTVISIPNDVHNYRRYLNEVDKYKLLTTEEELEYFTKYRAGDMSYYEKIAQRNLRFVISVAKMFQNTTLNTTALTLEDLISEGNLGLCIAIQKFDHTRGFKFISYAVWQIRSKISECIYTHLRTIRQPSNRQLLMNKLNKLEMQLQQQYDMCDIPSEILEECAQQNNVALYDKMIHIKTDAYYERSLDSVVYSNQRTGDAQMFLSDILSDTTSQNPQEVVLSNEKKEYLNSILNKLPDRTGEFFKLYYGLNNQKQLELKEIGQLYNLSGERVRQIIVKWTRRMCRYYEQEYNQQYT